jgi:RND superfamily putative drug exporter
MAMIVSVTSDSGVESHMASAVGAEIVRRLQNSPNVGQVLSAWTSPAAPSLISKDHKSGLIVVGISGDDTQVQKRARQVADELAQYRDGVTVRVGGEATIYWQINDQTTKDLLLMELIAMPLSFVVLVWVFGGLVAAAVPLTIGGLTILGSMAALHAITRFTDVSIFALNLCTALGMALAIDYTLLILTRYRGELAASAAPDEALIAPWRPQGAPCCSPRLRSHRRWSRWCCSPRTC